MSSNQIDIQKPQEPIKKQINIGRRLLLESVAGLGAAFTVTPIIKIVDISVTTGQSGKAPIWTTAFNFCKTMVFKPHQFVTSKYFGWIYLVYSSTYISNNCIDSICKIFHISDFFPKLFGVTAVNMVTSIMKDAAFAKYFGTKAPSNIPLASYLIWFVRDMLSIAAAFLIPARVSAYYQKNKGTPKNKADNVAQFAVPMGMQVFLLPVHLLGLDIYNNNKSPTIDRAKRILKNYPQALPLRFVRMASAYGIGGVNNKSFRNSLMTHYEGKDWDKKY